MKTLGDLVMAHKGQRICLMGGGPNLDDDLEKVKADVFISVNEHGAKRRPVDYIVAMDNTHTVHKVPMEGYLRQYSDAPIIGPWHWNDYQITKWPLQPKILLSGVIGGWVASLMGAHPLIYAGFDCYGGDARTINQHREYAKQIQCEVKVMSGPLLEIYPARPGRLKAYQMPDVFAEALDGQIKVRVMKPVEIRGREWPKGTELTVSEFEVRRQIKHKSLMVV